MTLDSGNLTDRIANGDIRSRRPWATSSSRATEFQVALEGATAARESGSEVRIPPGWAGRFSDCVRPLGINGCCQPRMADGGLFEQMASLELTHTPPQFEDVGVIVVGAVN